MTCDMLVNIIVPLSQAVVAALVVVLGWYVVHKKSTERDLANKRRDLRLQYLIEAYRRFSNAANRPLVPPYSSDMESAIAVIQLFGSSEQLVFLRQFAIEKTPADQVSKGGHDLLASLRDELRAELRLERVQGRFMFYRANSSGDDIDNK